MFVGHFGIALAAKGIGSGVSLGTLFLSVQLADLLWPLLLLSGFEHVRIVPGIMRLSPMDFWDYPISHSLAALAAWGILFGAAYLLMRRSRIGALLLASGVVSHWVLDFLMHRPDLPLLPRGPYAGLGLWNSVPGTLAVEGALYALGIAAYLRVTRAKDAAGKWALWSLVILLAVLWLASLFGPPPPSERALAVSALAIWLLIPWGYWIDRHRAVRSANPMPV
jgi:hypothetical protein